MCPKRQLVMSILDCSISVRGLGLITILAMAFWVYGIRLQLVSCTEYKYYFWHDPNLQYEGDNAGLSYKALF